MRIIVISGFVLLSFIGCSSSSSSPPNKPPKGTPAQETPSVLTPGSNFNTLLLSASSCSPFSCAPGVYDVKPTDNLLALGGNIGALQKYAQWTNNHYAILIEPGTYNMAFGSPGIGIASTFELGYYTQVLGVGSDSSQVTVAPGIEVLNQGKILTGNWQSGSTGTDCSTAGGSDPYCLTIGGLNNFWRGIENVTLDATYISTLPYAPALRWAVSQASPMRSVYIKGDNLSLCDWSTFPPLKQFSYKEACGDTSGGFMANVTADMLVQSGSQQQWMTRSSSLQGWPDGTWNMVFVGTQLTTAPAAAASPFQPPLSPPVNRASNNKPANYPFTQVNASATPVREKPYLRHDPVNGWGVMIPALRTSVTLGTDTATPTFVALNNNFSVISPSASGVTKLDVASLNAKLASGQSLIVMPGVYSVSAPIKVPQPTGAHPTVILGIGFPVFECSAGNICVDIAAETNVLLGGIIFEAGYQLSTSLLQVGDNSSDTVSNSANPNFLFDVFCRVAETQLTQRVPGQERQTTSCVTINANNTVGDNLWLWRGDHDLASGTNVDPTQNLVTWTQNRAQHGLIVNAQNVTMYGLAVEHFQDYQTVWNGNGGTTYFYQSEMPYDPTSLSTWTCSNPSDTNAVPAYATGGGCASYVVNSAVTTHTAEGLGVYSYFVQAPIMAPSAILAPSNQTGVQFTNIVGRWLNGIPNSGITTLVSDYETTQKCWGYKSTCATVQTPNFELNPSLGACADPVATNYQTPAIGSFSLSAPAQTTCGGETN